MGVEVQVKMVKWVKWACVSAVGWGGIQLKSKIYELKLICERAKQAAPN